MGGRDNHCYLAFGKSRYDKYGSHNDYVNVQSRSLVFHDEILVIDYSEAWGDNSEFFLEILHSAIQHQQLSTLRHT